MLADHAPRSLPPRLWGALAAVVVAFVVALVASVNLYLLEDDNPLTTPAYNASPLLRFSYDVVYLSALVAAAAVCAIVIYALARDDGPALVGVGIAALVIALGGFGGLLARQPLNFLALFVVYALLALGCFFAGRALAGRARLLGMLVSAGLALLVNAAAMVAHTLALNPASHALYMQGQLGASHFNGVLLGMGLEALMVAVSLVSLVVALRKS